jgi:hypothetical protein
LDISKLLHRGRTYRARLECSVEGAIIGSPRPLLRIVVKLKNVGLSKVAIKQEGTILQLHRAVTPEKGPPWPCRAMRDNQPAVFDVFRENSHVEPSEPVEDLVLVQLPQDRASAYTLILRVSSGKQVWIAKNVVQTKA